MPCYNYKYLKALTLCLLLSVNLLFCNYSIAQDATGLKQILNRAEQYREAFPFEKLHLQTDREQYTIGDTVWLKAYVFNAATYTPSALSSKIYVELINDSSNVVNRFALPLASGLGYGQLILNDKLKDCNYTIRAYTNWMQNFSSEAFTNKHIVVRDVYATDHWLISEEHTTKSQKGENIANLALHLTDLSKMAVAYRDVELQVTNGKRNLFKSTFTTSDGGNLKATIPLPEAKDVSNLSIILTDKITKKKLSLPFSPGGQYQKIDLQFMPEGGTIISGLPVRVGFKAIAENGLGICIRGSIIDNLGQEVNTFAATHLGMGYFILIPEAGKTYSAKYNFGGVSHIVPLPVAKTSGISLRGDALSSTDTVFVVMRTTPDIAAADKKYNLVVHSADLVYYGSLIKLTNGFARTAISKKLLNSGIVSISLLDGSTPVASRRLFIDHNDRLQLSVTPGSPTPGLKDSVSLTVNVCDAEGKPVVGSFGLAVIDNALNKTSSTDNITSRLLLSSELSGYVEESSWYFAKNDPERMKALDILMLCQGWRGFDWSLVNAPIVKPRFAPETSEQLSGNLRSLFKKPIRKAQVKLFSMSKKYGLILQDTTSDDYGEFRFDNLPILDTINYTLRVVKEQGGESIPNINLNEFTPAKIGKQLITYAPWYTVQNDTSLAAYLKGPKPFKNIPGINPADVKGRLLNEVTIKGKKAYIKSGRYSGSEIKQITEEELIQAKKSTLYNILLSKVKRLGVSNLYSEGPFGRAAFHPDPALVIGLQRVADIIVDGQSSLAMMGMSEGLGLTNEMLDFLKYMSADEVKDIRVAGDFEYFITVTTRSGNGYFTRTNNNIVRYTPVPYCFPAQFYRPRYKPADTAPLVARPTLHWEPNLITDKDGNATLSFYTADKPGKYTITIEGADMAGNFGSKTSEIVIKQQ
ncbi:hypothetical protein DYU05_20335 [Mucilaginibacter terrenus]|uniref:Carboxypeptidase regulatory-like domain-containing protein n=1 Tax=Mucilaginibacter terrenus TaxID=2482727 RepID=A0A3E2NJJ9_9SPHI|nr:hypothetical protein [Mucilaginibacter terrenus]RFZ81111.1 hypothetical protein DYU05_20335 [Mucilaginibacter terrenus]